MSNEFENYAIEFTCFLLNNSIAKVDSVIDICIKSLERIMLPSALLRIFYKCFVIHAAAFCRSSHYPHSYGSFANNNATSLKMAFLFGKLDRNKQFDVRLERSGLAFFRNPSELESLFLKPTPLCPEKSVPKKEFNLRAKHYVCCLK